MPEDEIPSSDPSSSPDLLGVTIPMKVTPAPSAGPGSRPTASHYVPELPLPEELQAMVGDGYVVESFLGQGGMGAVYRGLQMPLRRPVAIKILQRKGEDDDFGFEERFKREAYAMAALTHPHIVQVYDCGDAGENFLFISMELVNGGDLSDAIKGGKCTPDVALKLIPQICDALQVAHEHGIVHRDIKPANIFLTADGRAKVADFGLAKKFDSQSTFATKTGMSMGTPDYASPEQFDAVADLDHRADIYSLGVMMYQMLTGSLPRGSFKPASKRVAIDPSIDDVLVKCMEHDRAERYQSAAEIKADILAITAPATKPQMTAVRRAAPAPTVAPMPAATARPVAQPTATRSVVTRAPVAAPPPEKKKSSAAMIGGVLAAVAVIGAGAWMMMKPKKADAGHGAATDSSSGSASASVAPNASGVIDLLRLVDISRDARVGTWVRKPEGISLERPNGFGILELPYEPPDEYDFESEFTPTSGGNNVNFHLVGGGSTFIWKVNAHGRSPSIHGLDLLDGKMMTARNEAVVQKPPAFQQGQRYATKVEVRRDGIRTFVDGEEMLNWKGDFKRLSTEDKGHLRNARALGIGSYTRGVTFHKVTVHEVTGKGRVTSPQGNATSASAPAANDATFANTLGMKFVPVPGTDILMCIHETRRKDYAAYAAEVPGVDAAWKNPVVDKKPLTQTDDHPVVQVSWNDATAFCAWLSKKEGRTYRLPTQREWDLAIVTDVSDPASISPADLATKLGGQYQWGTQKDVDAAQFANYAGKADGFEGTAPVMSFKPNHLGIYDLGGNAWEWEEGLVKPGDTERVLRGCGYLNYGGYRKSNLRQAAPPDMRAAPDGDYNRRVPGFRIVTLATTAKGPGVSQGAASPAAAASASPLEPGAIKLWDSADHIPPGVPNATWEDDALHLTKAAIRHAKPPSRDVIFRASVRAAPGSPFPTMRIRDQLPFSGEPDKYFRLTLRPAQGGTEVWFGFGMNSDPTKSWILPRAFPAGEWVNLELRAIGQEFTVSVDGQTLGTGTSKALGKAGAVTLYAENGYYRDVVYVPLDKAASSAPANVPTAPVAGISEAWQNLLADSQRLNVSPNATLSQGLLTLPTRGSAASIKSNQTVDGAIRMKCRFNGERLTLSARQSPAGRYSAQVADGVGKLYFVDAQNQGAALREVPLSKPLAMAEEYVLELRVVGTRVSAQLNGTLLGEVDDSRLSTGNFGVSNYYSASGVVSGLEFLPLGPGQATAPLANTSPAPSTTGAPATALKDAPFVNTLGMKFVPVRITAGPSQGQQVLFSVWETRVQDFDAFVGKTGIARKKADYAQGSTDPATFVSWDHAKAFCDWLTEKERTSGTIGANMTYRLPSGDEWGDAIGDAGEYPWGNQWPPPSGWGNYAGEELRPLQTGTNGSRFSWIPLLEGYRDAFPTTAPVGSFPANARGIFDLGGNAWEWCEDISGNGRGRLLRGSSWNDSKKENMVTGLRVYREPSVESPSHGFRVVLSSGGTSASPTQVSQAMASATAPTLIPPTAAPVPLFDGKTLNGWELHPANFPATVVDGAMRIGGAANGEDGCIYYRGFGAAMPQFINYEVTLSAKTEKGGNSGLYIHGSPGARGGARSNGIEVQILNSYQPADAKVFTGGLQGIQGIANQGVQDGEWFDMKVRVEGKHVRVWLKTARDADWRQVTDWTQPENYVPKPGKESVHLGSGTVSFQNWGPPGGDVLLKEIRLQVLP